MDENLKRTVDAVNELPDRVIATYVRLWQLERWMRRMAYVELKAAYGDDWDKGLSGDRWKASDKSLTHMPTPEEDSLSYGSFSQLCEKYIDNWDLFSEYLPPKDIWEARIKELKQIRNRVAHFRSGHEDDLHRVIQFMRDIDHGFWRFCTSFNGPFPVLPPQNDPITEAFAKYEQKPYTMVGTTVEGHETWARVGVTDESASIDVQLQVLRRLWKEPQDKEILVGKAGYLYNLQIYALRGRAIAFDKFLDYSKTYHKHLVYICLDALGSSIRITLPSVLGEEAIIKIVYDVIEHIQWSLTPHRPRLSSEPLDTSNVTDEATEYVQTLANKWPEYVLGPKNPLTFLSPDMECSFFTV